jgi:tRNA nucleotidyltransferase (CCA-adding enzyme)
MMNIIRRAVNEWQLDHPTGSKADCETWLKEQWAGSGRAVWQAQLPVVDKTKLEKRKR